MNREEAYNVLKGIYSISEHAALTGALKNSYSYSMKVYNQIRDIAIKAEWINGSIFDELTNENCTNVDTVGVAAGILAAALK
jgi:hypothetical protein